MGVSIKAAQEFIGNAPTGALVAGGVGAAGLATVGIGSIVSASGDRKQAKADRIQRRSDARQELGHGMVVAGAIATAGVGGAGLMTALGKMK